MWTNVRHHDIVQRLCIKRCSDIEPCTSERAGAGGEWRSDNGDQRFIFLWL